MSKNIPALFTHGSSMYIVVRHDFTVPLTQLCVKINTKPAHGTNHCEIVELFSAVSELLHYCVSIDQTFPCSSVHVLSDVVASKGGV